MRRCSVKGMATPSNPCPEKDDAVGAFDAGAEAFLNEMAISGHADEVLRIQPTIIVRHAPHGNDDVSSSQISSRPSREIQFVIDQRILSGLTFKPGLN